MCLKQEKYFIWFLMRKKESYFPYSEYFHTSLEVEIRCQLTARCILNVCRYTSLDIFYIYVYILTFTLILQLCLHLARVWGLKSLKSHVNSNKQNVPGPRIYPHNMGSQPSTKIPQLFLQFFTVSQQHVYSLFMVSCSGSLLTGCSLNGWWTAVSF